MSVGKLQSSIISESYGDNDNYNPKEIESRVQGYINDQELSKNERNIANKLIKGKALTSDEQTTLDNSENLKNIVNEVAKASDDLMENVYKSSAAGSGFKLTGSFTRPVNNLKKNKESMTAQEKYSALQDYADEHNLSPAEKSALIKNYDGSSNVDDYSMQFINYNNYGRMIYSQDNIPNTYDALSDKAKIDAYETGLNVTKRNYQAQGALTRAQARLAKKNNGYGVGVVNDNDIQNSKLTDDQKDNVSYSNILASTSGTNINLFESKANSSGKITDPNGYYENYTNTISLDVNAGKANAVDTLVKGEINNTLSHELTHIAENAPNEWIALSTAVQNAVGADDFKKTLSEKRAGFINNHPNEAKSMSNSQINEIAMREAVADYCSGLLNSSTLLEQIAGENKKLQKRLKKADDNIISEIKELQSRISDNYDSSNPYAKTLINKLDSKAGKLEEVRNLYEKAVKQGIKNQNAKTAKRSTQNKKAPTTVQEQLRNIPNDKEFQKNIEYVANMNPVVELKGTEFAKGNINLVVQVSNYYKSIGNTVNTQYGKVKLNEQSVRDSLSHGIGRKKAIAFKAVPDVLKSGRIIDFQKNWKNKGNDRVAYAALISIADIPHYMVAIVNVFNESNNFYLHEVGLIEKGNSAFKTGTVKNGTPSAELPSIYSLLQKLQNVNYNNQFQDRENQIYSDNFKKWFGDWENNPEQASKVVDKNGKPLVLYHQTDADFNVFDMNKNGAGQSDYVTPNGIFLKPNSNDIGLKGKKQMALYAYIENPLRVNNRNELADYYQKNIDSYQSNKSKIDDIDREYQKRFDVEMERDTREYQKLWEAWRRGEISKEEYHSARDNSKIESILQEWEEQANKARGNLKKIVTKHFNNSEYDGIIINNDEGSFGRSTKAYIVFNNTQVKSATDNIGTFDKNNPDIRYQDRSSNNDIQKSVLEHFGRTYSWNETGYLTTDGQRLDFSGRHEGARISGRRTVDHRDILDGYPQELQDSLDGSEAMVDFISRGNIRIMPENGTICLAVIPTSAQQNKLRDYISRERGEIILEIIDDKGDSKVYAEYPRGTSSNKIISDIKQYFNNGTEPSISELGRYYYQDRTTTQLDRDYMSAVKRGDTETAQRMVDEAAERVFANSKVRDKSGNLRKVYHWTNSEFTQFDTGRSGSNQGKTHGDGIYVSTNKSEFKYAGENLMTLYADITNPFEMNMTEGQARVVLNRYAAAKHNLDAYGGLYRNHALSALRSSYKVMDYLKEYADDNNVQVSDILQYLGYDGVHDGSEWVAFDSGQLKSADPITYDDNGNIIPLSQRFTDNSSDIRFQDRDSFTSTDEVISNTDSILGGFSFDDGFDIDDDFDDDFIEDLVEYRKIVKDDPVEAVRLIVGSSFKTISEAIKSGVEISERTMKIIQNKIALAYSIPIKNADIIGGALQDFINAEKNESDIRNFETFINTLKTVLQDSEITDDIHKEHIAQINSVLKDTILDVTDRELPEIISHYDSWKIFSEEARKVGLRVRQAKNAKYTIEGKAINPGTYIHELIVDLNSELGYDIYNGVNGITTAEDDADGIIELVDYLKAQKELGTTINMYDSGMAENIDIAAVEMAFDTAREYIQRQGTTAVEKENAMLVRRLNELRNKQTKLLENYQSSKNDFKAAQKNLDNIKAAIDTVNEDSAALAELDKQIDQAENKELIIDDDEISRLKEERKQALNKLNKDNRRLSSLKAVNGMSTLIKNAANRATQAERAKWSQKLQNVRYEKNTRIKELENQPRRERAEIKKEVREEYHEARNLTEVVDRIKKLAMRMDKMLVDPNNRMYVPKAFKNSFLTVCSAITDAMDTNANTEVGRKISDFNNLIQIMNNGSHKENEADYSEYKGEFSADIFEALSEASELLTEKLEGKVIDRKNLTLDEANDIYSLLQTVYDTVRDATVQLGEKEAMTNRESGEKIRNEMEALSEDGYNKHERIAKAKSLILNGIRTARMYTGYNADSELMRHVYALEQGNNKRNTYIMQAEKIFTELTEKNKKAYDKSLTDVVEVEYTDYEGNQKKLKITRMLGLQILMSWERELNDRKLVHMRKGGIKVANAEKLAKGKVLEAISKATVIRKVTPSLITAIDNQMTDFEWKYKKAAEKYFNEYSKARINEVSNILKHRDLATAKYYIPFTVNSNEIIKELDALKYDSTIEGMGQLKTLVYNASQGIEITGLNSVIARHISDTAKLYGLAVPVRNFKKALNVQFRQEITDDGNTFKIPDGSVRESIQKVWGKNGTSFFDQILIDLESDRKSKVDPSSFIGKMVKGARNAFVVKTLTANISVIIKQAASYPTAGLYLSSASLTKGIGKSLVNNIGPGRYQALFDEIDAHTAQHYMRRKGMSTQEIADLSNSLFNKLPTALNATKWIQGVDVFTTALLWNATKAEINTRYRKSGKSIDTEEYWKDITELYDRVIEDTQPMYDSLHRTEAQKTTNELWKSVFMFKTQPLQNTGIMYDAAGDALRNKSTASKRRLGKAVASQVTSLAVFAGMTFAAAAALAKLWRYKDDDDEVTPESVFSNIGLDMFINGTGVALPIGGTEIATAVSNFLKGKSYDLLSIPFADMVNDTWVSGTKLITACTKLFDKVDYGYSVKFNDVYNPLHTFAEQMSGFFGVPIKNVENIYNGIYTYFVQHTNPFESQGGRKPGEYAESYGKNFANGDTAKAKTQLATFYQEKIDENTAKGDDPAEARKKAFESVRKALGDKYKLEYQKAYIKNDSAKMSEIESLLNASGFMNWQKKSLVDKLSEWKETAKDDIQKELNK